MFAKNFVPLIRVQRLKHLTCRYMFLASRVTTPHRPRRHHPHILKHLHGLSQAGSIRNYCGAIRSYHTGAGSIKNRRVGLVRPLLPWVMKISVSFTPVKLQQWCKTVVLLALQSDAWEFSWTNSMTTHVTPLQVHFRRLHSQQHPRAGGSPLFEQPGAALECAGSCRHKRG